MSAVETLTGPVLEWAEAALSDEANSSTSNLLLGYLIGQTAQAPAPYNPALMPEPAEVYDSFTESFPTPWRAHLEHLFEVVARPGEQLTGPLRPGDLVLRRGLAEGNLTHLFVLADGQLHPLDQARSAGLTPEAPWPGWYGLVIEPGTFRHRAQDRFARRLTTPDRRVAPRQLILRLKLGPALIQTEAEAAEPTEELPSADLRWAGASAEQLAFMHQVYDQQVSRSSRQRRFVGDVPAGDLAEIENGQRARTAAAQACQQLLAAARPAKPERVASLSIVSAYRSASQQFANWQRTFPRYYRETTEARAGLAGGEHGPAAVNYLAGYIGQRLAAPGFSLHNNGLAIDFGTQENGVSLGASTSAASIRAWRQSWFFDWLSHNAATYNFYQNTAINEPWHWEYRPATTTTEADTETLTEDAPTSVESGPITAGRAEIASVPLLSRHRGSPPDLILRWNDLPNPTQIVDVVVHLHGYSQQRDQMNLSRDKEPNSGLDFSDPTGAGGTGRSRPTLALLPRGNYFGGRSGTGYNFPALRTAAGMQDLITYGLEQFARAQGLSDLRRGRLILTAHSGGGADLLNMLGQFSQLNPDEVHIFDALYQDAGHLSAWAAQRLAQDASALASLDPAAATRYMREQGGALRVLYIAGTATASHSQAVQRVLAAALPAGPVAGINLADWYRVESTSVAHGNIPRRYGWRLLADASANLPQTRRTSL